ncbi:probable mediator of RNA polymerase II transcription subunit 26a [Phragmites australis]|uniref:probable mediator of RNA polymerase II transcription subunit 26a n=1 Tax=Phragmites australis TaxID=29695 RepID=UPI002D7779A3|nr:probable mediator of RNA polymerase II transcription subunit 26a [Phragmites australis]
MAGQIALRRWKPFLAAFDHVDAAIEAADLALSRDEFRCVRGQIVELLCDASDDGKAEELCLVLDDAMALSLVTLQSVPTEVVPRILASSADLAQAVGALRGHESERVRGLARDVVRGWRASVEDYIVRVNAAMEKLDALSQLLPSESTAFHLSDGRSDNVPSNHDAKTKNQAKIQESQPCRPRKTAPVVVGPGRVKAAEASDLLPKKTIPVVGSHGVRTENTKASTKIPVSPPKKKPPFLGRTAGDDRVMRSSPEDKMEATKRKLREGYQDVEDAKRQRKIQVIQAPKMLEQKQRKMHPIMRERSRARCASSTAVRRSLISSFQRV